MLPSVGRCLSFPATRDSSSSSSIAISDASRDAENEIDDRYAYEETIVETTKKTSGTSKPRPGSTNPPPKTVRGPSIHRSF